MSSVFSQSQDGIPGDSRENGFALGGDQRAVFEDKDNVHTAQFFQVVTFCRIQEQHLMAAVFGGLRLSQQRRGIVAARFGRPCPPATSAGVVRGEPNRNRGSVTSEVGTYRRRDQVVRDFFGRADTQESFLGKHKRAHVEGRFGGAGNPIAINSDEFFEGLQEILNGELRECHPLGRSLETLRIFLGSKGPNRAILVAIRLHSFKNFLAIVQH